MRSPAEGEPSPREIIGFAQLERFRFALTRDAGITDLPWMRSPERPINTGESIDCARVPVTQKDGVRAVQGLLMPILKQETDIFPPDLMEVQAAADPGDGKSWWAMYTRSRREKDLMRRLIKLNVPFYSPMIAQRHRSPNGRLRTSYSPLFSNYVFVCGDESDRYNALTTGCISRDIVVNDPQALIRDLREIHELINTGADLDPRGSH